MKNLLKSNIPYILSSGYIAIILTIRMSIPNVAFTDYGINRYIFYWGWLYLLISGVICIFRTQNKLIKFYSVFSILLGLTYIIALIKTVWYKI